MLYVTTRSALDTYTVQRAVRENRGPDGGFYRPFRMPSLTHRELEELWAMPFEECLAQLWNLLFRARLTGGELRRRLGEQCALAVPLRRRVVLAELWHNPAGDFDRTAAELAALLRGDQAGLPGDWVRIAARAAVLFGLYGQLRRQGLEGSVDVSLVSGDFSAPMSAWYARSWGLPIGSVVCCCNENAAVWELICHGQLRTDTLSVSTDVPEADIAVPTDLERLVFEVGGVAEVERYLDCCRRGGAYEPLQPVLERMRQGLYVSVVSTQRLPTTIASVYRTYARVLSPGAALAYGGLLDYRSKKGQTRTALVLAEKSPLRSAAVAQALGVRREDLGKII